MTDVPGVILAGGLSTRMGGGDKCLLRLGSRFLLEHVMARLQVQTTVQAINANGNPDRFADFGLQVIEDSIGGYPGPLAGVLAGMDWARSLGASRFVSVAADTPFFPLDLVERLTESADTSGSRLAMAVTGTRGRKRMIRHPTFGLWSVDLRDDLENALRSGIRKVIRWTEPHGCARVRFPVEKVDPFFNVNTPEDMDRAGELFRERMT